MVDKYTSLCDAIAENPIAADILMSDRIATYAITENQFSSLEEISIRYGIDINSIVNQINSGLANLY